MVVERCELISDGTSSRVKGKSQICFFFFFVFLCSPSSVSQLPNNCPAAAPQNRAENREPRDVVSNLHTEVEVERPGSAKKMLYFFEGITKMNFVGRPPTHKHFYSFSFGGKNHTINKYWCYLDVRAIEKSSQTHFYQQDR